MSVSDNDQITDIIKRVKDQAESLRKDVREQMGDQPYGHHTATDEQILALYAMKLQEFPPVPIQAPDGSVFVASPYDVMLTLAVNGQEWIGRIRDAVRRTQERMMEGTT